MGNRGSFYAGLHFRMEAPGGTAEGVYVAKATPGEALGSGISKWRLREEEIAS
jgi:hypothetical protein